MSRYGVNFYGPGTFYGEIPLLEFDARPMTAVSTDYGEIFVSWRAPSGSWDLIRLNRESFGFVPRADFGTILLEEAKIGSPVSFLDSGLQEGRFYYYTVWVRATLDNQWRRAGDVIALATMNWGLSSKLFEWVPFFYRDRDRQTPDFQLYGKGQLERFLSIPGFEADHVRTEYESLRSVNDPDKVSGGLLPLMANQLGFGYEVELGMRLVRQQMRNAVHIYKHKGSQLGVEAFASVMTGWAPTVTQGYNLVLDQNDASSEEGTGQWVNVSNTVLGRRSVDDESAPGAIAGPVDPPPGASIGDVGSGDWMMMLTAIGAGDMVIQSFLDGSSYDNRTLGIPVRGIANQWVDLPGTAGNYISTPDSPAVSIVGDLEITAQVAVDDWTPGVYSTLVAKRAASGQTSYYLRVAPNGTLELGWSADGTAEVVEGATVLPTVADGGVLWIHATLDVDNGAAGYDVNFYTSPDGITRTQLGTTKTGAGITSIFDGTAAVEIGSIHDGTAHLLAGNVYYAEIRDGIDGTVVAKFDANAVEATGTRTPTTVPSTTGETWTINGAGWSWGGIGSGAATEDAAYTLSLYSRALDTVRSVQTGLEWFDVAGISLGAVAENTAASNATNDWTRHVQTATAPTGAAFLRLQTRVLSAVADERHLIDAVQVEQAAAVSDYQSARSVRISFKADRINLVPNASFEVNDDDWTGAVRTTDQFLYGTASGEVADSAYTEFPVVSGQQYTISSYVYGPAGTYRLSSVDQAVSLPGTAGNYISTPDSPAVSLAGDTVLRLPGLSTNQVSTPDSAAVSVTGDLDLRVKVAVDDWVSSPTIGTLMAKYSGGGGTKSWLLQLLTNRRLRFYWSEDGSALTLKDSTIAVSAINGAPKWIRATFDVDNGASGSDLKFWTSDDGVAWTQLGATITTAGVTSIFDGTATVNLGAYAGSGGDPLEGEIHYAEIRDGISGTVVAAFNPSALNPTDDQTPTTVVAATGETWTITGAQWNWRRDNEVRSLRLDGTSGTYASAPDTPELSLRGEERALRITGHDDTYGLAPDTPALSITGDIDIRCKATLDTWSGTQSFIAKRGWAALGNSWNFFTGGGLLGFGAGALDVGGYSSVGHGFVPGQTAWVRVTFRPDDGAGGTETKYFTSVDGVAWTQLGSTRVGSGAGSIADSDAPILLGCFGSSTTGVVQTQMIGGLHYAEIRDGIDGTVVASFDANDWAFDSTHADTNVDPQGNTWTLNGNAEIVATAERRSLRLNGGTQTHATVPYSAALSITGDLDVRCHTALDDWTPGIITAFAGRYGYWLFSVQSDGTFRADIWDSGGTMRSSASTVATGFADGSAHWVRMAVDVDNGASGYDVTFYTSEDGEAWTQLGAVVTIAGVISIKALPSNERIYLGSRDGASYFLIGNVFYAEIRSGIDGTIVANADFTQRPWDVGDSGTATGVDTVGNTWTINGEATIQRSYASDLDIKMKLALDDWVPAVENYLIRKNGTFLFSVLTNGRPWLRTYHNGLVFSRGTGTAPVVTDGSSLWLRMTLDIDDGAGNNVLRFYTAPDGVTWTQLGTDVVDARGFALTDSINEIAIGGEVAGGAIVGNVVSAEIRNGIDGTVVANPSFENWPWSVGEVAPATGADGAGNTWTINGAAKIQRAFNSDLDVRMKVALDDWTPAADVVLAANYGDGTNRAWLFYARSTGVLRMFLSHDGVNVKDAMGSVAHGFANGTTHWVRGTWRQSDGRAQFFTSDDGVTWAQLGPDITVPLIGLYDTNAGLGVGAASSGSSQITGNVYYAEVRRGIDGPVVAKFDANSVDSTGPQDPSSVVSETGETWTINGGDWEWLGIGSGDVAEFVVAADSWTRLWAFVTASAATMRLGIDGPGPFYIDGIMAERGAALLDFFDGSSFSNEGEYMWEAGGTPGNTPSHYYSRRLIKNFRLNQRLPEFLPSGATWALIYAEAT